MLEPGRRDKQASSVAKRLGFLPRSAQGQALPARPTTRRQREPLAEPLLSKEPPKAAQLLRQKTLNANRCCGSPPSMSSAMQVFHNGHSVA